MLVCGLRLDLIRNTINTIIHRFEKRFKELAVIRGGGGSQSRKPHCWSVFFKASCFAPPSTVLLLLPVMTILTTPLKTCVPGMHKRKQLTSWPASLDIFLTESILQGPSIRIHKRIRQRVRSGLQHAFILHYTHDVRDGLQAQKRENQSPIDYICRFFAWPSFDMVKPSSRHGSRWQKWLWIESNVHTACLSCAAPKMSYEESQCCLLLMNLLWCLKVCEPVFYISEQRLKSLSNQYI